MTECKEYKGIDYGMGFTNRDKKTGIRYGVIPQNEVLQAWADSSEADYGKPSEATCPHCKQDLVLAANTEWSDSIDCPHCEESFEVELPEYSEPLRFTYSADGYECSSDDHGDIFITKSPYYTYAQFCSPCAPGACYLTQPLEEKNPNNKCYCFGHDWFDEGKAPYPVYLVATNEEVKPD